jgi:phosphomannomutase
MNNRKSPKKVVRLAIRILMIQASRSFPLFYTLSMSTTSNELIVSVSGIRGIIGTSLPPDQVSLFAAALGTYFGGGRVLLARDSRPSGNMLRHAVMAGLTATGCDVEDIGIAPTPTVGVAVRLLKAKGAIQITASHNPAPWNGLKMFGADGAVLSADKGKQIQKIFETKTFKYSPWNKIGQVGSPPDVEIEHIEKVCDSVSVATIASGGLRVFLDGNGGAGGPLGVQLLKQFGCEVIEHACAADGEFVHEAEPIPAHLVDVAPLVSRTESHVGFVLDPDSDRLALIDELGNCISEELTLALAVKQRLSEVKGPVAINMSTSRVIEDLAFQAGCECARSAVGEANVVGKMRELSAVIGGEGNGGVIDPRIGWVRDPFIGMGLILQLMAETGKSLSELVADLPKYAMLKTKYTVAKEKLPQAFVALQTRFSDAETNTIDGLRLDWRDRWLHVRSSNTEPIVRIIAEAPTAQEALTLCEQAGEVVMGV